VSFKCYECRPAHHSFGLQDEACYPCNALWMKSKGDDVKWAIFNQKCTDGEAKATIVISVTTVFIVVVGTICCCFNRSLEKLLRKQEKESGKLNRRLENTEIAKKFGAALGMRVGDDLDNTAAEIEAKKIKNLSRQYTKVLYPQQPLSSPRKATNYLQTDEPMFDKKRTDKSLDLSAIKEVG
jgi:hypothetical protein